MKFCPACGQENSLVFFCRPRSLYFCKVCKREIEIREIKGGWQQVQVNRGLDRDQVYIPLEGALFKAIETGSVYQIDQFEKEVLYLFTPKI